MQICGKGLITIKVPFKRAIRSEKVRSISLFSFFFKNNSRLQSFRVIRERAHGRKTGRFIFTHERPALRVIFSLSGEERDFCARERHDFSFPTSTVKLTSKSLRTTVEGPSFSTPRGSRDAGARTYTRCPKRYVP